MKGDVFIVEEHHRRVAHAVVNALAPRLAAAVRPLCIGCAGESGSGKSTLARALCDELTRTGFATVVLQQDDYFAYPPKTNDARRREHIGRVGPQEVRLDLLDEHLAAARAGVAEVQKPLVIYAEDCISEETLRFTDVAVVIAEGTYVSLLDNLDVRIFIERTFRETVEGRRARARDALDDFVEQVLEIEHNIIARHRERADLIVTRDDEVVART